MATELTARFSADSSGMSAAIEQLREKLSTLSTSLVETKQKIKEANTELAALEKEQRSLAAEMKDGGTKEQQAQMQILQTRAAQLTANLGQLKAREKELQSDIGSANRQLTEQKNGMNESAAAIDKMKVSLSRITTAAKAFVAVYGGKKLFEMLIGSNAEMEQYQTSMEVMLGDAEKAQQMIEKMRTFAAKTPLAMTDIVSTGTLLMNYGVDDDELIDTMTKLGDLASGNAEKLNRVSLAYGQMLAKGKVSGEELRQMTEAGVPLQAALAESIGVTGEEFSKMVSTGKVGIDDLNKAITELTSGDGKFSGMMEKQAQTMQGMLSTINDNVSEFFRKMGEGTFENVKNMLSDLLAQLNDWEEDGTLEKWSENLGGALSTVFGILKNLIAFALDNSDKIIAIMGTIVAHKMWSTVVNGATTIIKAFRGIGDAVTSTAQKLDNAASLTSLALTGITVAIASAVSAYDEMTKVSREYREDLDRINSQSSTTISNASAEADMIKNKAARYDELRQAENLTAKEENELKTIAGELKDTLGDHISIIDDETGAYNDLTTAVDDYCNKLLEQAKAEAEAERLKELYKLRSEKKQEIEEKTANLSDADKVIIENFKNVPEEISGFSAGVQAVENFFNPFAGLLKAGEERLFGRTINDQDAQEIAQTINALDDLERQIASTEGTVNDYNAAMYDAEIAEKKVGEDADDAGDKAEETDEKISRLADTAEKSVTSFKNLSAEYSELASAVEEYHENGELSIDTALQMIENGYAAAVSIDEETGAVKLNIEAYQDLAKEKLKAKQVSIDLEKQQLNETNAILMNSLVHADGADRVRLYNELTQNEKRILELNKLTDFYISDVDNWSSPDYKRPGTEKTETAAESAAVEEETDIYRQGYEAYKTEADKKIDLIEREIEKKKELRDETIKAIDDEIAARKRLNEDKGFDEQINAIRARLKYDRLDDFSREQLKKQLGDIYDERAEVNYQRAAEDKKTAADEKYESDAAVLEQQKAQIETAVNTVKAITEGAAQGISSSTVINNNNSTRNATANINIANNALSLSAIKKAVKDALMDAITIK